MPRVVRGEVGGKVANKRVERPRAEELEGEFPLRGADEGRIGNDLDGSRFERLVQFTKSLGLAAGHQSMKLVDSRGFVGQFVDIVMEGVGVLNSGGKCVVLIVEGSEEFIPPHPKLPGWP